QPAAGIHPGLLLAGVEPECQTRIECQRRVLADIERGQRMAALDRTGLRGVPNLQRRHDLAASKHLNIELLVRGLADTVGPRLDSAGESVEALRPARCQPPTNRRIGLSDRRTRECGRGCAGDGLLEKSAPFHFGSPCWI